MLIQSEGCLCAREAQRKLFHTNEMRKIEGDWLDILGQVWYLIGSIPDLCTLTYYESWCSLRKLRWQPT